MKYMVAFVGVFLLASCAYGASQLLPILPDSQDYNMQNIKTNFDRLPRMERFTVTSGNTSEVFAITNLTATALVSGAINVTGNPATLFIASIVPADNQITIYFNEPCTTNTPVSVIYKF